MPQGVDGSLPPAAGHGRDADPVVRRAGHRQTRLAGDGLAQAADSVEVADGVLRQPAAPAHHAAAEHHRQRPDGLPELAQDGGDELGVGALQVARLAVPADAGAHDRGTTGEVGPLAAREGDGLGRAALDGRDEVAAADAGGGAAEVATLEYASVAIVTLVLAGPTPGAGSGYLVPAVEGRTTKAVTFSSRKWPHLAGKRAVIRASVGRAGEAAALQRDDAELVSLVRDELALAVGPLAALVDSRVTRWGGGLPQYAVGHKDRVRRIRAAVARQDTLAVAGAAYDGVGVPACARSGREAAQAVLDGLAHNRRHDDL